MPDQPVNQADLVVRARWVIPVEPAGAVLEDHAVVVSDGRIVAVLPGAEAARRYRGHVLAERPGHALIPGLVNAHTHGAMSLMRGLADDLPLSGWLAEHVWPVESRWAGPEFVRDGTRLALLEMVRSGTTCFNDMYYFPDVVAALAVEHHVRAAVGMIVIEQPTPWARTTEEYFNKGLAVHDQYRGHGLVQTTFAPHAPYTVSDATLRHLGLLAGELDVPVHMHVHETAAEVAQGIAAHGVRPLERLARLGLLAAGFMAVHATELSDADIAALAAANATVVHCPASNLKLASGFAPVARLLAAGVNVALGTDGAASNNSLDMLAEMRLAALLAKGVAGDATALPATAALAMATLAGARALGLGERIGSLVPGKLADMICVDLGGAGAQPVHHPVSQLVYAAPGARVSDSWIGGRQVLAEGRALFFDEAEVLGRAAAWRRRLAGS